MGEWEEKLTFFQICSDLVFQNTCDLLFYGVLVEFRIVHSVYNGLTKVFSTS